MLRIALPAIPPVPDEFPFPRPVFSFIFGSYFLRGFLRIKKILRLLQTFSISSTVHQEVSFQGEWNDNGNIFPLRNHFSAFHYVRYWNIGYRSYQNSRIVMAPAPELVKISTLVHDITSVLFAAVVFIHILLVLTVAAHRRLTPFLVTGPQCR